MANDLPDYAREEKGGGGGAPATATAAVDLPDYAREEKPDAGTSALDVFLNRFRNAALPGHGGVDDHAAQAAALRAVGVPEGVAAGSARVYLPPGQQAAADAVKPMMAVTETARQAQAGSDHPLAAGLGTNAGTIASMLAMPGFGKALGAVGPAASALSKAGVPLAGLLAKAVAGGALSVPMSLYKGEAPTLQSVGHGAAMTAAPVLTALATGASALAPGLTPEERATRGIGAVALGVPGAAQAVAEGAPGIQDAANHSAARAIYSQQLAQIRRSGGYEGALKAAATALKEGGIIKPLSTAADIGENALNAKERVGQAIASDRDAIQLDPDLQYRMTPGAMEFNMRHRLDAKYGGDPALRPLLSQVPRVAQDLGDAARVKGIGQPLTFAQREAGKSSLAEQGYPAGPSESVGRAQLMRDAAGVEQQAGEDIAGEQAQRTGPEAFQKWLQDKARYGDLANVAAAGDTARMRALANRGISLSDYQVGTGGGVTPASAIQAFFNKQLRERGNSTTAAALNGLAKFGRALPDVFGGSGPPPPAPVDPLPPGTVAHGPPGAGPLPLPPRPGATPPLNKAPGGWVGDLPAPNYHEYDPVINHAEQQMYDNLLKQHILPNSPLLSEDIVNPTTGRMILPAQGEGYVKAAVPNAANRLPGYAMNPALLKTAISTKTPLEPVSPRAQAALEFSNPAWLKDHARLAGTRVGQDLHRPLAEASASSPSGLLSQTLDALLRKTDPGEPQP